jgi:hypothetical protein
MGVLDDAIKEHLELKRQHGADEAELRKQEVEALGPARREASHQPEGEPEAAAEPDVAEAPVEEVEPDEVPRGESLEAPVPEPSPLTPELEPEVEVEEPEPEPEPEEPEPEPEPEEPQPASEEEDVLEETPDFLQETPEHDRLWFEQKPPRDFDFDE